MTAARGVVVVLLLFLWLSTAGGQSAGPDMAFETIALRCLTAGEVAPLLAPHFQFVGRAVAPAPQEGRGELASFVPEGVKPITAGSQSSRNLLVAGSAEGVAELRGLLSRIDAKPQALLLSLTVYPAPLSGFAATKPRRATEPSVTCAALKPGQSLSELGLPAGVAGTAIRLTVANASPEFVPLPAYRGWPQGLLVVTARVNADRTVALTVGAGLLEDAANPLAAVEQARSSPAATGRVNPSAGERAALVLSRGKAGVTVVVEVALDRSA
jgi:hypothetical protein